MDRCDGRNDIICVNSSKSVYHNIKNIKKSDVTFFNEYPATYGYRTVITEDELDLLLVEQKLKNSS